MPSKEKELTDSYIRRSLTLLRAAEGEAITEANKLKKLHLQVRERIKKTFEDKPTKRTVRQLQLSIDKQLGKFYNKDWPDELVKLQSEVVTKEIIWNQNNLGAFTEASIATPRAVSVVNSALKKKYQGKTFDKWIGKAWPTEQKRVSAALRSGFIAGDNVGQMVSSVRGILNRAESDVRTITRSFFMHNATEAKESVFKHNPKLVEGKMWISTLDSRTTPLICGLRDQQLYNMDNEPVGHSFPWEGGPGRIHWNCRSSSIPQLKDVKKFGPRPSVGAGKNYERGDNVTRTGRVRKPHKAAREKGIYKAQIKTTRTRYEGWLKGEANHNIDFVSDVLGSKEKAQAFRDGKVTLAQLSATSPVANPLNRAGI